jgi:hypothetical protein
MATKWNRPMRRYRPDSFPQPEPAAPRPTYHAVKATGGRVHRVSTGSIGAVLLCSGRTVRDMVPTDAPITCGSCC